MVTKNITIDNGNLFYKVTGAGEAVILIHGFAEDSTVWDHQIAFLKDQFTVIIPDLPGTGASVMLPKENCSLDDYADCIQQILAVERIEKCSMIGHSMGGYITLAFAEKFPGLLYSFLLFHSSAYADNAEKIAARKKGIEFIKEKGAYAFLKTTIPGLFYDVGKSNLLIDQLIKKGEAFTGDALIQYYEAMIARPDRTAVLKEFAKPIGFIMGAHDKAVPFQHSLQQSYLPAISHIAIFRKTAHMGMLEEKEQTFTTLADFLQAVYV